MILYDGINIFLLIVFLAFFILSVYVIIQKESKEYIAVKRFLSSGLFILAAFVGWIFYDINFVGDANADIDAHRISDISVNIETFKTYEKKLPTEKDFYLSGFLNNSMYFSIENGKKLFTPLYFSRPVQITNHDNSLSMIYTYNYDEKSFLVSGRVYRYCLNLPGILKEKENIKDMKMSVNGKDFDYKTATKESMKDICYSDKPNTYSLIF